MKTENKKVKIESVRWELTPIFNEKYIDENELKTLSEIEDEDELVEVLEDILRDGDFIYTSEGTDYLSGDYNGELNKIYVKNNEHSIYLTSAISIGNTTISTSIDNLMNKQIEELIKEHNSLKVESIKSIIRDIKIEKLLK